MTDVNRIRNLHHHEKKNLHQTAKDVSCSWATAKSYAEKSPEEIAQMGRRPHRQAKMAKQELLDRIQELLKIEKERKVHRKQRYTARTLFNQMKEESLFEGCERYFRKILKKERVIADQQKKKVETHLELSFPFGEYLQFDHGPLEIELNSHRGDAYLFVASVPGYCLRFCQLYKKKSQESWGCFHEEAYKFFGGIFKYGVYDNDSVLKHPKTRELTSFSVELIKQYDIEMVFCNKGKGNEKGAVENAVGTCRRLFLAGVPSFSSIEEANIYLCEKMISHTRSQKHYRTKVPLIKYQEEVKEILLPLKEEHEWGVWQELRVDSSQRIQFQNHFYSVPEKHVGEILKVYITPIRIKFYSEGEIIASHLRCFYEGESSMVLDHYLDQLEKKPRAIKFSKVIQDESFPDYIIEIRDRLRTRYGIDRGDSEFIRVLKLKRLCSSSDFETAIRLGFSYGGINSQAIKSFIDQLQLSQRSPLEKLTNLSDKLTCNLESKFSLSPYAILAKKGGFRC